jgi:hypothetical protein
MVTPKIEVNCVRGRRGKKLWELRKGGRRLVWSDDGRFDVGESALLDKLIVWRHRLDVIED